MECPKSQSFAIALDGRSQDGSTTTLSSFRSPWTISHRCSAVSPEATSPERISLVFISLTDCFSQVLKEPCSQYSTTIYGRRVCPKVFHPYPRTERIFG